MNAKPNILLILTDQQTISTLSCYGETPCQTPNLDELAEQSIVFNQAYTTCPLCTPARATIMTGLYPHQHGMTANCNNTSCAVHNLQDKPELLSRKLAKAGYDCIYTGKWHLGSPRSHVFTDSCQPSLPKDVGFAGQNFPGHGGGGFRNPEYKEFLKEYDAEHKVREDKMLGKGFVPSFGILEEAEEYTVPYFLANHTIEQIDRNAENDKPFFIWHNFWGPHEPYYIPHKYYDMYRDVDIPEWGSYHYPAAETEGPHQMMINPSHKELSWADWAEAIRHYYAFVTLIDEQIGRIIGHLEQQGILANTMIIFAADHGESLGSHGGLMDKGNFHFDEIQRIPLIMFLPDRAKQEKRFNELVSLADIYPTLLSAAGAEYDAGKLPGRSLFDLIGGCQDWRDDLVIQSEGVENVNISLRTLRYGRFKYCFTVGMKEALYDLESDPFEMNNLAANPTYFNDLNECRSRLINWMREHKDRLWKQGVLTYVSRFGWEDKNK